LGGHDDAPRASARSEDKTVLLWDAATGQLRQEQPLKHVGSVTALSITPDVRTLAAAAWDPRVPPPPYRSPYASPYRTPPL